MSGRCSVGAAANTTCGVEAGGEAGDSILPWYARSS